jgi:hypothetical protein
MAETAYVCSVCLALTSDQVGGGRAFCSSIGILRTSLIVFTVLTNSTILIVTVSVAAAIILRMNVKILLVYNCFCVCVFLCCGYHWPSSLQHYHSAFVLVITYHF